MLDIDSTEIEQVRNSTMKDFLSPNQTVHLNEDSAHNYARFFIFYEYIITNYRAKYTVGKELVKPAMNSLRKLTEQCDGLQGFHIMHAVGGGTGSGFLSS